MIILAHIIAEWTAKYIRTPVWQAGAYFHFVKYSEFIFEIEAEDEITFTEESLRKIVQDCTREAGVRNLERQIGSICRKNAVKISVEGWTHVLVTPELVLEYLKKEKFESEFKKLIEIPGIATGLAVTHWPA
jgi:ATP-dependent Lon protease